ncbi:MAG: aminomethyl transferase family protein [Microbacterium sp.]|uniref:aminomethyl transferase family protein n=1 Tax=Microbacterium sp. TaxID=51671 RepID=UPI0026267806|nr:aminomethyl transferase family protein [Microbacterium sp.]MCX6502998.1 aminomethyl transferase family protein [Microbacterium sp.]
MAWDFVSLQQGVEQAGSPVRMLWKLDSAPWKPPIIDDEYVGWAAEQGAWRTDVTIADLSYHMSDTFLRGRDALRLLGDVSANDLSTFAIGQAKQFIPVAYDGNIITDGILLREGEESFVLSGVPAAQNWVAFHAARGGYDVEVEIDPDRSFTPGDPRLFRLQVQGPAALALVERAFGGPLPATRFFHSTPVSLARARFRALRHGMAGQAGYEFIGAYADHDAVKAALVDAGADLRVALVGALAYSTNGVESGWIPAPTPAIYADPRLADYRSSINVFGYEGQNPLHGSFFSERIEDYYASPWEFGYGRSISLEHDFIGRDALAAARETATRRKVTLEFDADDVAAVLGESGAFLNDYGRHRIEQSGQLVGITFQTARIAPLDRVLALSLVEAEQAIPGTRVEVVWGEHPGPDSAGGIPDFPRIAATVRPAPYDDYARVAYRSTDSR